MEETLQYHIKELGKARQDYNTLFENFKHANKLAENRDIMYRNQLLKSKTDNDELSNKVYELKCVIKAQKIQKLTFQRDVEHLEIAANLLEIREEEMQTKNENSMDEISKLQNSLESLSQEHGVAIREIKRLKVTLSNDSVPLQIHQKYLLELEQLKLYVEKSTVTVECYEDLLSKMEITQNRMEQEMISREDYKLMVAQVERLKSKLELECVPLEEYAKLKEAYHQLVSDATVNEETNKTLQESHDQTQQSLARLEAKCRSLKSRVEASESELQAVRKNQENNESTLSQLRSDLAGAESSRSELLQRVLQLESNKAALLTQIGHVKQTIRRDNDEKAALGASVQQAQEKLEKVLASHKTSLSLAELQCADVESRCAMLEEDKKHLQDIIISMKTEVHGLEGQVQLWQGKTAAAQEDAHSQTALYADALGHNELLRQDNLAISANLQHLQQQMDELNDVVRVSQSLGDDHQLQHLHDLNYQRPDQQDQDLRHTIEHSGNNGIRSSSSSTLAFTTCTPSSSHVGAMTRSSPVLQLHDLQDSNTSTAPSHIHSTSGDHHEQFYRQQRTQAAAAVEHEQTCSQGDDTATNKDDQHSAGGSETFIAPRQSEEEEEDRVNYDDDNGNDHSNTASNGQHGQNQHRSAPVPLPVLQLGFAELDHEQLLNHSLHKLPTSESAGRSRRPTQWNSSASLRPQAHSGIRQSTMSSLSPNRQRSGERERESTATIAADSRPVTHNLRYNHSDKQSSHTSRNNQPTAASNIAANHSKGRAATDKDRHPSALRAQASNGRPLTR